MAKKISTLANGALVKDTGTTYYGKPIVWRIADKNHSGYPSNSTTLITDKIIKIAGFDGIEANNADSNRKTYGNNRYRTSNLRQWLNSSGAANSWWTAQNLTDGTANTNNKDAKPAAANMWSNHNGYDTEAGFLTNFSAEFKAAMLATTLTVAKNTVTDGGGSETVSDKIFLASTTEVGLANENSIAEGAKLAIFSDNSSRLANPTAEAVTNSTYTNSSLTASSPWWWWLRTPYAAASYNVRHVDAGGTLHNISACSGYRGVRPLCNLSSEILVSDTPDSDGAYTIIWNQPPTVPGSITVSSTVLANTDFEISWGASTDPEGALAGYKLERSANNGAWTQIYSGQALKYTDTAAATGVDTLKFRVNAYDTVGAESAYKTSGAVTVVPNSPPEISGSDGNIGVKNDPFTQKYTITAGNSITITAVEKIDGKIKRTYNPQSGVEQTFSVTADDMVRIENGQHTLTITANDQYGATSTRTYTFTRAETKIEFTREPMRADAQPERFKATISCVIPDGATIKIYVCNNGFDESPTWEDATDKVLGKLVYHFTNTVKTAANWGVNVKVCIDRNGAEGECYISGMGGNFD